MVASLGCLRGLPSKPIGLSRTGCSFASGLRWLGDTRLIRPRSVEIRHPLDKEFAYSGCLNNGAQPDRCPNPSNASNDPTQHSPWNRPQDWYCDTPSNKAHHSTCHRARKCTRSKGYAYRNARVNRQGCGVLMSVVITFYEFMGVRSQIEANPEGRPPRSQAAYGPECRRL